MRGITRRLRHIVSRTRSRRGGLPVVAGVGVAALLAIIGTAFTALNYAATATSIHEPEHGDHSAPAEKLMSTNASGGHAVWFSSGNNPAPNPSATPIPPVGTYDPLGKKAGFVFVCTMAKQAHDDPIVFPNQPGASHLHTFAGTRSIDAFSRATTLVRSTSGTSCAFTGNKSVYWIPTITNSDGTPMPVDRNHIYYQAFGGTQGLVEMPFGMRMLAGDPRAASEQTYYRFGWRCRIYSTGQIINSTGIPHGCDSGQRLQAFVVFPSCWDGKNLDSANHRSHLAYNQAGVCPATHPVRIPEITFEADYNTPPPPGTEIRYEMEGANLTRYGLHADAFEAWDPAFSRAMFNVCLAPNRDCVAPRGAFFSDSELPPEISPSVIGGLPIPPVD